VIGSVNENDVYPIVDMHMISKLRKPPIIFQTGGNELLGNIKNRMT